MQVHVKTPHIELTVMGDKYKPLIDLLRKDFGDDAVIFDDEEDEFVEISQTQWFADTELSPAETVKIHRRNLFMTQLELGEKIGGKSKQYISDIETGRRGISLKTARLLSLALGHHYKAYL